MGFAVITHEELGAMDPAAAMAMAQAAAPAAKGIISGAGKVLGGLRKGLARKKTQYVEIEGKVAWGPIAIVGGVAALGVVGLLVARAMRR